jgi:hypothetical protein
MTPKKKPESALGRGLDALIRSDYLDEEEKKSKKIKDTSPKIKKSTDVDASNNVEKNNAELSESTPKVVTLEQETPTITFDEGIVENVLSEVNKNPRISLWSAKSAAVLRFLKKTKPEFSISNEASLLIEAAVQERHPEIWKMFEEKGL